jgi:hypothetical protein
VCHALCRMTNVHVSDKDKTGKDKLKHRNRMNRAPGKAKVFSPFESDKSSLPLKKLCLLLSLKPVVARFLYNGTTRFLHFGLL